MAKWTDEGENWVADVLFDDEPLASNLYLGLYTDASEPAETDGLADITEATGTSYARKTLARGSWSIAGAIASFAEQTFTAGSNWGEITGYFISTSSDGSGKLLAVESFTGGPYNLTTGSSLKITPKITVA